MEADARIGQAFDGAIAEFVGSGPFQDLLGGRLTREAIRRFVAALFVPHYQSAHILAFGYALLTSEASDLLKQNMLEEMGADAAGTPHPQLLIELAKGAGFSESEVAGLAEASQEAARQFCAQPLPFPTLRDMGLAILLEAAAFEHLLSRHASSIARSLCEHYSLPVESLRWFDLHSELDIRHAEESLTVLHGYVAFHRMEEAQIERILRATFTTNPFTRRYFPSSPHSTGPAAPDALQSVTIFQLRIPFREVFRHAQVERSESDAVVVRVEDAAGSVGYGEGLPREYVTGETVSAMAEHIKTSLGPGALQRRFGADWSPLDGLDEWARPSVGAGPVIAWNAATCALELAILDWWLRARGSSLADYLPPVRREVTYSGVVSATGPDAAAALARRFTEAGIDRLKVKVGVGDDGDRLRAIRDAVGPNVLLRADANGAWTVADAIRQLRQLEPYDLECIEQPVGRTRDHVADLRAVRQEAGVPVMADESLVTLEDARLLAEGEACDFFNVRISKNGGIASALAIARLAESANIGVLVGAQVGETAILSAAGRAFAAHLSKLAGAEGSFGALLLSEDIGVQEMRFGYGGVAPVLTGPGLGVDIREDAVERLAVERVQITR